jgi:hypothetical protein
LRQALREGGEAVREFCMHFNDDRPLPSLRADRKDWPTNGWHGQVCGYFDALELADWYIDLEQGGTS